jgi:predicted alpha/beta superfamily hydrolase
MAFGAVAVLAIVMVAAYIVAPRSHILLPPRASNGTEYVLYASVPEECRRNACTALYLLDGERWLPTFARAAAQGLREPIIIVGIGYRDILNTADRRKFDFTPTFGREPGQTGGADAYLRLLQEKIIPYAETHLPIDTSERAIAGHSYAGLFATYAFARAPDLFDRYLIMSPALWFDDGAIFEMDFAGGGGDRRVFLAADTPEDGPPSDMARDVERLSNLFSGQFATVSHAFYLGETHESMVAPSARDGLEILYGTAP